jgi:hypothetical protein
MTALFADVTMVTLFTEVTNIPLVMNVPWLLGLFE